ncbi:MAG: type II toxin-antitoxin system Phd/YefM family antitoxin [Deltaproteobacteria bacterium]|nr:type II toxin-antitoxin system Phd/YefM family antitoxin [Candidatus Tectomicrobia bacterium]MBI2372098.1 type II toxin-antitoxin system Phd/YefM family antitoxin [Deltaproteobacteria bacterium]MBI3075771.1 type II toxin-antitoxin system Phd/YefM family antitoxin [Deltaproteobacteria bacterium]
MRFVSVRELKANPSAFLRLAAKGETVVVAVRGKPTAVLRAITEEELEDYILENSPRIKRMVAEGERDRRAGRVTPLERYIARLRARVA